ncbi:hypothetical protein FNV43_RR24183 [Rhamnella rubrinervis]|uniref:Protein kinase domain-containing protein n=1 Tax=Rhamnella rubrinervis TaxID=2594499 RepID=A0A8K0DQN3_9ROSA|nr:hypothetical protein FNV43_RR24183 [Rhamnella rubrinervis]
MPSRQIFTAPAPALTPTHAHYTPLLPPVAAATATAFSVLLFLLVCFRKVTRKRTAPEADSKPPHRFPYSLLRRSTDSFAASRRLGQGGFGPVFYGTLPKTRQEIAVKLMDSGSLQGEREFQNEIFFASMLDSQHVVSVLGFSSDRKRRRMLLVYEFMSNGNLQDALLHRKCPELMEWKKRFATAVDIAKGLQYLHGLEPPIIHGDIKPSNILLDRYFSAKIGDFGLARLKLENQIEVVEGGEGAKMNGGVERKKVELESNGGVVVDDYGSVVEETESVATGFEELNAGYDLSPESFVKVPVSPATVSASPEAAGLAASPEELEKFSTPEGNFDKASPETFEKLTTLEGNYDKTGMEVGKQNVRKDWWWKQQENGAVKDYVMEWIGTEIKNEKPNSGWTTTATSSSNLSGKPQKKKNRKQLDWWMSMDEVKNSKNLKKEKRRPAREWWKEEYCEELAKKKKKKMKQQKEMNTIDIDNEWWLQDEELGVERKKKKNRSRSWGSKGSMDWWLDGLSGELWRARRDTNNNSASGEIPKSGGISSTPSMRGTVCYVAPEYGYGENASDKCDVYSFGVLLLVLIAGRRPLQVTNSPLSEYQRANLLSWARNLARNGKLIELVDKSIQSLDEEEAVLCITVALLCLQKSPTRRPSMKEVVGMLIGELERPQLPPELSPSPQPRFPFKSHKRVR